jgi:2,3-bisphosphoglycerate-dependent phosphoglycerate mutase
MGAPEQKWIDHLVIVRHGESDRNVSKQAATQAGEFEYGGTVRDVDVRLTDRGIKQSQETGMYLATRFRFDRVFASPYLRALETARLMMQQFNYRVELTEDERIREKEFGILDGLTKKGIVKRHPEELRRREREGKYYYRPPGGESYPDVSLRLHSFLGTLSRDCRKQSVLLVCHSVVVLMFRRLLERLTEKQILAIDRDPDQDVCNCSVTWYAFDRSAGRSGKLLLREFNRVCYPAEYASTEECERRA